MQKGIVTGILVVLGVVITIVNPIIMGVLAIPTWIYLIWVVRKRKSEKYQDQIETLPVPSEKDQKMFKTFMLIAGISFLVSLVSILLHNFGPDLLGINESVSFYIGVGILYVFIFSTAGALLIFLKERQKRD